MCEHLLHASSRQLGRPTTPLSALQGALRAVVDRHEILRTRFVERDSEILQAVLPVGHPDAAPRIRKRTLPPGSRPADLEALVDELTNRPYQLLGAKAPARFFLLVLAPGDAVLVTGMHHIIRRAAARMRMFVAFAYTSLPLLALSAPAQQMSPPVSSTGLHSRAQGP